MRQTVERSRAFAQILPRRQRLWLEIATIFGVGVGLIVLMTPIARQRHCQSNLRALWLANQQYARDFSNFPLPNRHWNEVLVNHAPQIAPAIFQCPQNAHFYALNQKVAARNANSFAAKSEIALFFDSVSRRKSPSGDANVWPLEPVHRIKGGFASNVVFLDGHLESLLKPREPYFEFVAPHNRPNRATFVPR